MQIGFIAHSGVLAGQASYTATESLSIPPGLSGPHYVIVRTDSAVGIIPGFVEEFDTGFNAEENNITAALVTFPITWTPPDLQVSNVTSPANVIAGQRIIANYTTTNAGAGGTVAVNWQDQILLATLIRVNTSKKGGVRSQAIFV